MSEFFHFLSLSSCQQDMYSVVCLESLVFVSEDPPLVLFSFLVCLMYIVAHLLTAQDFGINGLQQIY
jgi:hypothetical protein